MITYLVTVKLPKNPAHDPHNKLSGACPADPNMVCTDKTGEHHSILINANGIEEAKRIAKEVKKFKHITRIETVSIDLRFIK
jgi:hypothetical protein